MTQVFIIHARKFTQRKAHMDSMMKAHPHPFDYILEGDADTLTPEGLSKYFSDQEVEPGIRMNQPGNVASCTLKHFLAYERILAEGLPGALILEDDAILFPTFDTIFQQSMKEYEATYADQPVIISYEDTRLRFVPRSKREKGRLLYPGDRDRYAGAYFINQQAAQTVLHEAKTRKCHLPIDLYHRHLLMQGKLLYLWCQPPIATQGSHTGFFPSTLEKKSLRRRLTWKYKLAYKKLLYWLR